MSRADLAVGSPDHSTSGVRDVAEEQVSTEEDGSVKGVSRDGAGERVEQRIDDVEGSGGGTGSRADWRDEGEYE